ncbi:MAG: TolC family protein [Verrucomicrobiota bacterium]
MPRPQAIHPHSLPALTRGPALLVLSFLLASCSSAHYFKSASKETETILDQKGAQVPNMEKDFSIKTPVPPSLVRFAKNTETPDFLGDDSVSENNARIVSLADALQLGVTQNREYRNRKELLYLQALELTFARHEFAPIPGAAGEVAYGSEVATAPDTSNVVNRAVNALVRDNTVSGNTILSFSQLRKLGTRLTADLTSDFLKFVTGDRSVVTRSEFLGTLTQPLLRGAGYRATMENLTQAERNLLYAIRDFSRFRKEFSVQIATSYYQVLQARDSARNAYLGYTGFQLSLEREQALAEEDRRSKTELGLIQQAALNSESQWVNAVRDYAQALDDFKIDLGVPIDSRVILADAELEDLTIIPPELDRRQAAEVSLLTRLDLQNDVDEYADTARRIKVFRQDLLPRVDFVASVEIFSGEGETGIPVLDFDSTNWNTGAAFDLELDKKEERNAFRASFVAHQRTARELDLAIDEIKQEIYDNWRNLEQAERQYEIAQNSVQLAASRLEEQQLLMEIGRGTARDLVEAQNDLTDSQNQRTAALVNHTIARLDFWRDMGVLFINKDGSWIKKLEEEKADDIEIAQTNN